VERPDVPTHIDSLGVRVHCVVRGHSHTGAAKGRGPSGGCAAHTPRSAAKRGLGSHLTWSRCFNAAHSILV
jgi:hypothetical protein